MTLVSRILFPIAPFDFEERYALTEDRTRALELLVPGTEDYYFYDCLHAQHTEYFDAVYKLLNKWIERYGYTDQVNEIRNRQALLEYDKQPEKYLKHIKDTLHLNFNHQQELETKNAEIGDAFDPAVIGIGELTRIAFDRYENLQGFEDAGLDFLDYRTLDPGRRRDLLHRLKRPDIPGLARLVVEGLNHRHSGGFGSHNIHSQMLLSQLDECLRLKPDLIENSNFIFAYLAKLAPNDDTDIEENPTAKRLYLESLWAYVRSLNPAQNSLKVHVLYHLLDLLRYQGRYDLSLFMEYLKLPRNTNYVELNYLDRKEFRQEPADLNADFTSATMLRTVYDDSVLVEDYLANFFYDANNYKAYKPYIQDEWLKRVFAETNILSGVGDMEKYYSMMTPDDYNRLKQRIDIEFALTNPLVFGVQDEVRLNLDIKNVIHRQW